VYVEARAARYGAGAKRDVSELRGGEGKYELGYKMRRYERVCVPGSVGDKVCARTAPARHRGCRSGLKAMREAAQPARAYSTSMDRRIGNERPDGEGEREQMARAKGRVLEQRSEGGERARHKAGTRCTGSTAMRHVCSRYGPGQSHGGT
jgi:hypothetical protein